jgi:hypothetical protein
MAINWLVLRTKRSPSLLLLLGDFKHAEREEEEEKEAFVPAFWVDSQTHAFAAAAESRATLLLFKRRKFVARCCVFVIRLFEKEEKDLQF